MTDIEITTSGFSIQPRNFLLQYTRTNHEKKKVSECSIVVYGPQKAGKEARWRSRLMPPDFVTP